MNQYVLMNRTQVIEAINNGNLFIRLFIDISKSDMISGFFLILSYWALESRETLVASYQLCRKQEYTNAVSRKRLR
jgi:hypothetical protein